MSDGSTTMTHRERELAAIINAYNEVTERLKESHEALRSEVARLSDEVARKNLELARRERLSALGEMAAGLAHEIRNPLGGIQMYVSLLARDLTQDQLTVAEKISKGVRALDDLVGEVLVFAGDGEPQLSRVRLKEIVSQAMEFAEVKRDAHDVQVAVARAVADVELLVDEGQLLRAVLNLLMNAIEAAPEGGHVWIDCEVESEEGMGLITVSDDGEGIEQDMLERVFNPFFTTKDQGTGLGLAIVHRIAEAHGGRVSAGPRKGGGATFTLTLPLYVESQSTEQSAPSYAMQEIS